MMVGGAKLLSPSLVMGLFYCPALVGPDSGFQGSGVGDRFWKMGTHFPERSSSLENSLCVTWSGFRLAQRTCCGY